MPNVQMDWDKLLSATRYELEQESPSERNISESSEAFQGDAIRILYSSAFRRLQGKAQVHSFPTYDYLRTRLTHTIEVANLGRLIGVDIAKNLVDSNKLSPEKVSHIGDVVYAGCLAHDLGNPPFGHSGERAIQTWFTRKLDEKDNIVIEAMDTDERRKDFTCFDGNAQGFRVITRLANWKDAGGARLTYAVIGAFTKYPHSSNLCVEDIDSKKKFGYMQQDQDTAIKIFEGLGLISETDHEYKRHPLAYIVEAADDICYLTTDIEDAHRIHCLDFAEASRLLKPIASTGDSMGRYYSMEHSDAFDDQDRVGYLRAAAIRTLSAAVIKDYQEAYDDIMTGRIGNEALLERGSLRTKIADIRIACREKIYIEERKMQTETAGYHVIISLMDLYGGMILQYLEKKGVDGIDSKNKALYNLSPVNNSQAFDIAF